jgi:hypothetical protein
MTLVTQPNVEQRQIQNTTRKFQEVFPAAKSIPNAAESRELNISSPKMEINLL